MRDAFSGVVTIQFILAFIAIISGYLAFSVSYTRAVHVKDFIINKIEEYESSPKEERRVKDSIDAYMRQVGYHGVPNTINDASEICDKLQAGEGDAVDIDSNNADDYVVCKFEGGQSSAANNGAVDNTGRYYYGVVTYITIDIPIVKNIMTSFQFFKISGKTRLIKEH